MVNCRLSETDKIELINKFLANRISAAELEQLRDCIDAKDLAVIIQRIYDLNNKQVMKIAALEWVMGFVDGIKNNVRTSRFLKKINNNFRVPGNKIILAEGDSWFNYPIILTDVIDWIAMEPNFAVSSLASGGDWLLNMLSQRVYVEELSILHPDVFLISAGGNDLVGRSRVAAIVDPTGASSEFNDNEFCRELIAKVKQDPIIELDQARFNNGLRFLSKDFYALLMFFHLQYHYLINGILTGNTGDAANSKFPGIQIITQGYDYAQPSHKLGFGLNPLRWYKPFVRMFLGHGSWLKTPLQMRGINNEQDLRDVVYAMIYLFNEMMIKTGDLFCKLPGLEHSVFHVDSRGAIGDLGWTDELHPLPRNFKRTGETFIKCINREPSKHGQVYVVNDFFPLNK
jgi:hypothetical protein